MNPPPPPSNQSSSAPARKNRGRQRVNLVKMENQSNLQVTFSKRRNGLFKKASELCTLCGAEAAILVFSPAEKAYCFGHPSVQTVLDRLSSAGVAPTAANPRSQLIIEAHRNSTIRELNLELTQLESMLRAERKRAEELDMVKKTGQMQQWIPTSFDNFSYPQLCVLKESIMGFKKNLDVKVRRDMARVANNPLLNPSPAALLGVGGVPLRGMGFGGNSSGLFAPNNSTVMPDPDPDPNPMGFFVNATATGTNNTSYLPGSGGFSFNLGHDPRFF